MFLSREDVLKFGFKSVGENVLISDKCSIYGAERIELGNNVRIDDFCFISAGKGGIKLGDYIHISVYSSLVGAGRIVMEDFSGLSSKVSVYSSTDDYSGAALTNPTVPVEFTNVYSADVIIEKHVVIGCGSVVLPGVTIKEGSAVGALSLVKKDVEGHIIVSGVPAKKIADRKMDLYEKEKSLYESIGKN
jgi:acetyltransferase-like isoleucine patch superfamily enzyme